MIFSPKAIRFLIEALECYEADLERRAQHELSEDELADVINDRQYVAALRRDLQQEASDKARHILPSGA
jgi:hypothetical protein